MRNLFGKYRKKDPQTALADIRPRGIHHTVKPDNSYNETWNHIWEEIKSIGISAHEKRDFVSQEIYSYVDKTPIVQASSENANSEIVQHCNVVSLAKASLMPFSAMPKSRENQQYEQTGILSAIAEAEAVTLQIALTSEEKNTEKVIILAYHDVFYECEASANSFPEEFNASNLYLDSEYFITPSHQTQADAASSREKLPMTGHFYKSSSHDKLESTYWQENYNEQGDEFPLKQDSPVEWQKEEPIKEQPLAVTQKDIPSDKEAISKEKHKDWRKPILVENTYPMHRDRLQLRKHSACDLSTLNVGPGTADGMTYEQFQQALKIPRIKKRESICLSV